MCLCACIRVQGNRVCHNALSIKYTIRRLTRMCMFYKGEKCSRWSSDAVVNKWPEAIINGVDWAIAIRERRTSSMFITYIRWVEEKKKKIPLMSLARINFLLLYRESASIQVQENEGWLFRAVWYYTRNVCLPWPQLWKRRRADISICNDLLLFLFTPVYAVTTFGSS